MTILALWIQLLRWFFDVLEPIYRVWLKIIVKKAKSLSEIVQR